MSLAAQTAEQVALYEKVTSLGEPLPIHVNKIGIPDGIPSDQELREVVRGFEMVAPPARPGYGQSTSRCGFLT